MEGEEHCGIISHSRDKFQAAGDHYYSDGGSSHGRQTAKTDPTVVRTNLSTDKILQFRTEEFSPSEAISVLIAMGIPDPPDLVTTLDDFQRERERLEASEFQTKADQDAKVSNLGSLSLLGFLSLESLEADEWTDSGGEGILDDKSWAAVAKKHRESISALERVMTSIGAAIPRVA